MFEAARVAEQPVATTVTSAEGLGVGVAYRAPGRLADVEQKQRGRQVLPGAYQFAADAAVRGRRLLHYRRRWLAPRVPTDAPPIGWLSTWGEAAQVERWGNIALERNRQEVRHSHAA